MTDEETRQPAETGPEDAAQSPQPETARYRPLAKATALALLGVGSYTAVMVYNTTAAASRLASGAVETETTGLTGMTLVNLLLLFLAAWTVINWTNKAQDNLPAIGAQPMDNRLEWLEWLCPGINLVYPYFGMAELSKKSAPDSATSRGERLATIRPWWLMWATAVATGIWLDLILYLSGHRGPLIDDTLTVVSGVLGVMSALPLTHILVTISRHQEDRHRALQNNWEIPLVDLSPTGAASIPTRSKDSP